MKTKLNFLTSLLVCEMYTNQVHSNKRPHECDVCGKTFKRATTVRVHKRTVHGSKVNVNFLSRD